MISLDRASYQVQPRYAEYAGLSTDVKPVEVDNGDEFQEIDTGFVYKFDAETSQWMRQPTGSGGGGGTNDYNDLINLPQINGVELIGNKTSAELGIAQNWEFYKTVEINQNIAIIEEDFGFEVNAIKIIGLCSTTIAANYAVTIKGSGGVTGYKNAVISGNSSVSGAKDRILITMESSGIDANEVTTIAECKLNNTAGNSYFGYFTPKFPATGLIISMSNPSSEFVSGSVFRIEVKR